MTADEIKKIEGKFGITLPSHYVTFIMNFQGLTNNDNTPEDFIYKDFIYTSSERLIEVNAFMGFYSSDKIIKNKLIIGDNGGGDYYLIDLKNSADKKIYFLDHEESIENYFDEKTNTWNWDALDYYQTLPDFEKELQEMFGLSE